MNIPSIIKPDMKSVVWAAIGFFVVPKIVAAARR